MEKLQWNINKKYKSIPSISFSSLFPREILEIFPEISDFSPHTKYSFLQYLFPEKYQLSGNNNLFKNSTKALTQYWNGNIDNRPPYDDLFLDAKNCLIQNTAKQLEDFHEIIEEIYPKLYATKEKLPEEFLKMYTDYITELCQILVDKRSLFSGLSHVNFFKAFPLLNTNYKDEQDAYVITLAHLIIIACTSSIWCKPEKKTKKEAENAADLLFPCTSANILDLNYHDGIAQLPRICWSSLFPNAFCTEYQTSISNQKDRIKTTELIKIFIPEKYRLEKGNDFLNKSETYLSNYWGGKKEGNHHCNLIKRNILRYEKNISDSKHSLFASIQSACTDVLRVLSSDFLELYQKDIHKLYQEIQNNPDALSGLETVDFEALIPQNNTDSITALSDQLAFLVIIASTWLIWCLPKYKKDAEELSFIIFPQISNGPETDKTTEKDWRTDVIDEINKKAKEKLASAKTAYNEQDFKKCGDLCRDIITIHLADDSILGDAYYYLVQCHDLHGYRYEGYYNRNEFMYCAVDYGSEEACKIWKARHLDSLLFAPKPTVSTISNVISNTPLDDPRMDLFMRSCLENPNNSKSSFYYAEKTSELTNYIKPDLEIRFLLIRDDFSRNFIDLLHILDTIKNWNHNPDNKVVNSDAWKNHTIYVRLEEEKYASLLDTALKHMEGILVKVHLIDDNKWAAQNLLYHFPLFYPIRSLSSDTLSQKSVTINLNIISEHNNSLTNWIIREAYWLGCFHYTGVTLKINILSPEAKQIVSRLSYDCPGIFKPVPDASRVSKIAWNYDTCVPSSLESGELFDKLALLKQSGDSFNYYIVNMDTDIDSLNTAVKIREWEIRNAIKSSANIKSMDFSVITYRCDDLDIANLAESMVVHQETNGDSWYNNYSLIPFGTLSHYLWDDIDGGYIEKVSQSVHLQYYECDTDDEKSKETYLEDYFTRCYNRDSSFAVALSMPYRLFQMSSFTYDHIMPIGWVLKNKGAYSDKISREFMAVQAEEFTNKQDMLNYERARWMRWMISRGWYSATADETIKFMKDGNPKRQLYIGLLHGCICSQSELATLQQQLYLEYTYSTDKPDKKFAGNDPRIENSIKIYDKYLQFDIRSLEQTSDIIRTAWFPENEQILPDENDNIINDER